MLFVKALRRPNAYVLFAKPFRQPIANPCFLFNALSKGFHESQLLAFPRRNSPHRPARLQKRNTEGHLESKSSDTSSDKPAFVDSLNSHNNRSIFDPLKNQATINGQVSLTGTKPDNFSSEPDISTISKVDEPVVKPFQSTYFASNTDSHSQSLHEHSANRFEKDNDFATKSTDHDLSKNESENLYTVSDLKPETTATETKQPEPTESTEETARSFGTRETINQVEKGAGTITGIKDLPSEKESKSSSTQKWLNTNLDKLQMYIFTAGQTLNEFTGYSSINSLKKSIENQENLLNQLREEVRECKEAYTHAINNRSASQREVNELLQRKHAWSPVDLERFTELYRNDHANQHEEAAAERALSDAERSSEEAQAKLSTLISARYHEEQIWSDKIRRASTWGTWGLMGINICLFVIVQLVIEPRKRARMVNSFEEVMKKTIEDEKETRKEKIESKASEDETVTETPKIEEPSTLGTAVAAVVSPEVEQVEPDENSIAPFTIADRKRLNRIEELTESEYQVLQRLTSIFPEVGEPAEVFSDAEIPYSKSQEPLDAETLTWRNLPHRLLGEKTHINTKNFKDSTIEPPETLVVKPIEMVGSAGAGAAFGILIGVLITLIAKN